jgi:DNA-binding FadR family transcriptional regulator
MSDQARHRAPPKFTPLQGQYLAFIQTYTLIHRVPPAERDMQYFFGVTAPAVHDMVLTLDTRGLVARTPGKPRSLRVLLPSADIPALHDPREGK